MECSHNKISNKKVKKEIFDMTFEAKTSVCDDCGAHLCDSEYEKKYMQGSIKKEDINFKLNVISQRI